MGEYICDLIIPQSSVVTHQENLSSSSPPVPSNSVPNHVGPGLWWINILEQVQLWQPKTLLPSLVHPSLLPGITAPQHPPQLLQSTALSATLTPWWRWVLIIIHFLQANCSGIFQLWTAGAEAAAHGPLCSGWATPGGGDAWGHCSRLMQLWSNLKTLNYSWWKRL